MKTIVTFSSIILIFLLTTTGLRAAGTYSASLKAGDDAAGANNYDAAITEFESALGQATNPTEKALALGKKAMMLAAKQDYQAAKTAAEDALNTSGAIQPVAEVTALEALATCQMKLDENYPEALVTLDRAAALSGVDWAKPSIMMKRGDCQRQTADFSGAIASYEAVLAMPEVSPGFQGVAWLNIGLTHQYNLLDKAKAREAYAKAVALNPGLQGEVDGHLAKLP